MGRAYVPVWSTGRVLHYAHVERSSTTVLCGLDPREAKQAVGRSATLCEGCRVVLAVLRPMAAS